MKTLYLKIIYLFNQKPLPFILILGGFFRLISVIFSKGWGMHDDHFLVIEIAQGLVKGADNVWIPSNENAVPSGHSFFYMGFHYILFYFLDFIHIYDPQIKMYFVRFFHAIYSLSLPYFGYKITELIASQKEAKKVGLLFAIFWLFPILSVRNLAEFTCIPPLLLATYFWCLYEKQKNKKLFFYIGIFIGLAMGIRFQTIMFSSGFFIILLLQKKWKLFLILSFSFFITFFLTQISDLFIWKFPFTEFLEYVRYNLENKTTYFSRPWYMYFLTLSGLLIPPVSIFLFFGFWKMRKQILFIFLPTILFFIFHSYFPNKQERFIIPIIPFIFILGIIGWEKIKSNNNFWIKNKKLHSFSFNFFWAINILFLVIITPTYSKKSRAESMYWLYKQKDYQNVIIESSIHDGILQTPKFYSGSYIMNYKITSKISVENVLTQVNNISDKSKIPNYIIFYEDTDLKNRVANFQKHFGKKITKKITIYPSFLDHLLFTINPNNENYTAHIYKINYE